MAEVIDLEEIRRFGLTLRRIQADQSTLLSRIDGLERRLAIIEERQAELEGTIRLLGDQVNEVDRKLDMVTALVRDDVARLERQMEERFAAVDRRFEAMDRRFEAMDRRFEAMETKIAAMDAKIATIDGKLDAVLAALAAGRGGGG